MPSTVRYDRLLCGTILALTFFGLVMVFSATTAGSETTWTYVIKQSIAAAGGLAAMRYLMFLDYRRLRQEKIVFAVLGVSVVLLVLAALLGTGANTRRFLRLGYFSLQPSELAKPALILFLAFYLEQRRERLGDWRTAAGLGFIIAVLSLLIYVGRDFGTMASLIALAGVMLFAAGLPLRFIAAAGVLLAPVMFFFVWLVPYRRQRLIAFLNPDADPLGSGFQILQAEIAVGSGGWFGQGWMAGKQKMHFLPEAHTDFIFALIGEELGLLGAAFVVLAFGILLWRGLRAAVKAPNTFGCYLALGVTAMIIFQAMFNMGVVLALLPTKGMPLPFISYGGSAMMTMLASSGVLLNVSRYADRN